MNTKVVTDSGIIGNTPEDHPMEIPDGYRYKDANDWTPSTRKILLSSDNIVGNKVHLHIGKRQPDDSGSVAASWQVKFRKKKKP